MKNKLLSPMIALVLLLIMGAYFVVNPSYEKSIKAKYYYEIGNYSEALSLSKEAFSIDIYNRMASTIMAQSLTSLKYTSYIDDAKKYMLEINEIAGHEFISDADKAKIKLICEIMLGDYVKLAPSVVTDKELVKDAADYYKKFEELLEKVNKQI
jgi:tetratricopeptide (TPR) repeat protein